MATGNSGLGSSLFRGALHGTTSNTNAANTNSQNHHPNHQLQVAGPSHHHQHLSQQQPQQQQQQPSTPSSSQPQMSLRASIFAPEQHHQGQSNSGSPDHMTAIMEKLYFDQNVEMTLRDLKKEEHDKRIRDLRKQLDYIADTNWKYSPVEKFIGQL